MPTIYRKDGFEILIYTNDHTPSHVHVFKAEGEVVINLGNENTPPQIRDNIYMNKKDERKALLIVAENQELFLAHWRRIHG